MAKNFIKGAIKHPGALHNQLGIPKDEPIPASTLSKAAKAPGKLGQRARFAETLKGLPHPGKPKKAKAKTTSTPKTFAFSGIMGGLHK